MYATLDCAGISNFSHIVPTEIGGINALEGLLSATLLGKTVLDADLMGRAFPHVYMTVLGVHGKILTPAALSDGNGNIMVSLSITQLAPELVNTEDSESKMTNSEQSFV